MNTLERVGYLAHARSEPYHRRLADTMTIIHDALATIRRPYISMSFGKDSVVMTDLLLDVIPDAPVIYVNCGEFDEWPDTSRVRSTFLTTRPCHLVELMGPSIIDFYRRAGCVSLLDAEDTPASRQLMRAYNASLAAILIDTAKRLGCDGGFIGMRGAESINRMRLFNMRGTVYFAKTRDLWVCCPLAKWRGRDVWAHIVARSLPYNELYDLHPDGRELARNGAMIGWRFFDRSSLSARLRQMYPDWWQRLALEFPELCRQL